jgi:hypothetical protein
MPAGTSMTTNLPTSTDDVVDQDTTYYGYAARETGGAAATTVILRAGSSSGAILETFTLAASESIAISRTPGRRCPGGIHATISGSGVLQGCVYHA